KVLVVYHKNSSGAFTQFLGRLKDGFDESPNFTKGFLTMYRLHAVKFHLVEVDSYDNTVFLSAIRKAVEQQSENFDIAIIETKEEFKKLLPLEDMYWLSK